LTDLYGQLLFFFFMVCFCFGFSGTFVCLCRFMW